MGAQCRFALRIAPQSGKYQVAVLEGSHNGHTCDPLYAASLFQRLTKDERQRVVAMRKADPKMTPKRILQAINESRASAEPPVPALLSSCPIYKALQGQKAARGGD